ncbi:uncharacterized protein LOC112084646 [Eutrema salsugineum]|uniref:uncharacterized protein LOC112084646 n=1 Tax=Eutrema salsugineum TaxID=72664 RepID=UPI000CECEEE2|nr:uncharacterized protein LOC112084646 [Eutrema salsugineum]
MPISYTNSSSSKASYDSGCAKADGDFGIPERCYCGLRCRLEESTAPETFGRKFYSRPEILGECDKPGHISKWWDEAIEEQLTILQIRIDKQSESMFRDNRTALLQSYENRLYALEDRLAATEKTISEIEEFIGYIQSEIAGVKEALANRGSDILLCVFLVIFAVISCVFMRWDVE